MPLNGPFASKKSGSYAGPPSLCGPLSLVEMTSVRWSSPELLDLREQLADLAVHAGDHRRLAP